MTEEQLEQLKTIAYNKGKEFISTTPAAMMSAANRDVLCKVFQAGFLQGTIYKPIEEQNETT